MANECCGYKMIDMQGVGGGAIIKYCNVCGGTGNEKYKTPYAVYLAGKRYKAKSIAKSKAYMICFAFIWGGIMLSELVRRVL